MADTSDFRNGMVIDLDGTLFQITYFQHVKPGKGGAFVRTKVKNLLTGKVLDRTFRSGEKVQEADVEDRQMQYLYNEGESLVFMDTETYEQLNVESETLGDATDYLIEGSTAILLMFGAEIVGVDLPAAVELTISDTEPGIQGDRVSGATKPATLETGLVVSVPLFINPGEQVKVDTRSGEYLSRA